MANRDRWYWNWPGCLLNPKFWSELLEGLRQFQPKK